jgi:hypothetical protein
LKLSLMVQICDGIASPVTPRCQSKYPIDVPIMAEIAPHEWLAGEFRVEQPIEESDEFGAVIGRYRSGVTANMNM